MFAFKEWTLICDALGSGQQSLILRKGGIAEGRAGFRFEHAEFLLFPTLFHEQVQKLKLPADTPLPATREDAQLEIRHRAHIEWTRELSDLGVIRRLAPFHLWQDEVIEERFQYDGRQSLSLAFVRVARLTPVFTLSDSPRYGGCRSWVALPELPPDTTASEVLDEAAHRAREREIQALLD